MAEDNNVTAEVLARIAIAVTAEVVKSGTISNNATATTIIAAEVAAFASDPRYAEHRESRRVLRGTWHRRTNKRRVHFPIEALRSQPCP